MTIITPTGDRPQCFALCEKWMARQTLKPHRWIVVDDGHTPTKITLGQEMIRLPPRPDEHTLARNLLAGLGYLGADWAGELCVIEDDDWYAPHYLATMEQRLNEADLVGEGNALYYRLDIPGYRWMGNTHHASLAGTGMKGSAAVLLTNLCRQMLGRPGIDLALWRVVGGSKKVFSNEGLIVQFKAMPGRAGNSSVHRRSDRWRFDTAMAYLKLRIGREDLKSILHCHTGKSGAPHLMRK